MSIIQGTAHPAEGYNISRSLRFNSADSAYLNWTPSSAGNRRTWTWSGRVKRSALGTGQQLFSAGAAVSDQIFFQNATDVLKVYLGADVLVTSQVFRDVGAFFHLIVAVDTTQATASNRVKLYINGSQVTAFSSTSYPVQNYDTKVNDAVAHNIGRYQAGASEYFNGYLTEVNFIDGQALTPSSFGETDVITGVWKPKKYSGAYGTNGFYLNFSDNSGTTATTLGKDYSGNGNNWTPNNFSVTAGAGNDSLVDVPTLWGSDTGVGGEVRGNYATLNPLNHKKGSGTYTLSNGNLVLTASGGSVCAAPATIAMTSGKWYAEFSFEQYTAGSDDNGFGVINAESTLAYLGGAASSIVYIGRTGEIRVNNSYSSFGATYTTGDIIGVAFDADTNKIWFAKNGTWQASGNPATGANPAATLSGVVSPCLAINYNSLNTGTLTASANFGARAFAYTAPSGFKALVTTNLPEPAIKQGDDYFNAVLYTGNGSTQSITGVGFQPDLTWIKSRSAAASHALADAVRGSTVQLSSNNTDAEITRADTITSFGADGFNLGANTTGYSVNLNGVTYAAWNWKANGAGVTNTAGTITSTVSANTTSGFSIGTYAGTSANATVGHGLGVAPKMIIIKARNNTVADHWGVYHGSLAATEMLYLNLTNAKATGVNAWNSTAPTSTVFSLGPNNDVNRNLNYVFFAFAPVPGYSAFGSYTGNGSLDGPFIFTGFRPRYFMWKRTDTTADWGVVDTARDPENDNSLEVLYPNGNFTPGGIGIDILANGVKMRNTSAGVNANGGTYIYAAFGDAFKFSLAR